MSDVQTPTKRYRIYYGDRGEPEMSYTLRAWDLEHAEFKFWDSNWEGFELFRITRIRRRHGR